MARGCGKEDFEIPKSHGSGRVGNYDVYIQVATYTLLISILSSSRIMSHSWMQAASTLLASLSS